MILPYERGCVTLKPSVNIGYLLSINSEGGLNDTNAFERCEMSVRKKCN